MKFEHPISLSIAYVLLGITAIFLMCLLIINPATSQYEHSIFEVKDPGGSYSGYPPNDAEFYISQPTTITKIRNYHCNSGGKAPEWIGLKSNGNIIGRWDANGENENKYWVVQPNIRLEPGNYVVVDSDVSTWSQNSNTGGRGITRVYGR